MLYLCRQNWRREAIWPLFFIFIRMIGKDIVKKIVEEYLKDSDRYLVDLHISDDNRIVIEIDSEKGISIDDCISLTKHIESVLNRDEEDYELEVSSAGITSPFKHIRQYRKNIGNEVEVLSKDGKKHKGVLKTVDEDTFSIAIEKQVKPEGAKKKITVEETTTFSYAEIKYTKYIIRFK